MAYLSKLILITLAVLSLNITPGQAALRLSVNPVEGGSSLNFGRIDGNLDVNKTVRLRVTSDEGKQYQVYQRLQDPLVNQENSFLGEGVLNTFTVQGSNASGTLYAQSNELLGQADQLIFTSSADGQGDTLTVAYTVNTGRLRSSGNFVGRIAYTVRSLGDGGHDQAVLTIYLEASGGFKVTVEGARSPDRVFIRSSKGSFVEDGLKIKFEGNLGQEIRIFHELEHALLNEQGEEFPVETLQLFATSSGQGNIDSASQNFGRKRQLLYRTQETAGELALQFSLDPQAAKFPKAGTYHGRIRVTVESSSGVQEFPLEFEIVIEPVFDIEVKLPAQGVRFNRVLPFDPPQTNEVLVKVTSNLGKPYVVMQNVATPLVDADGDQIKEEFFTLKAQNAGQSVGRVANSDFVPVGIGERAIYYSDPKGTPSEFKIIYRLQSYPDIQAGEYGAPIVFSLGEM